MQQKRTIPRVCHLCGADFLVTTSHARQGQDKFCSRPCSGLAQRTVRKRPYRAEDIVLLDDGQTMRISLCDRAGGRSVYLGAFTSETEAAEAARTTRARLMPFAVD